MKNENERSTLLKALSNRGGAAYESISMLIAEALEVLKSVRDLTFDHY